MPETLLWNMASGISLNLNLILTWIKVTSIDPYTLLSENKGVDNYIK